MKNIMKEYENYVNDNNSLFDIYTRLEIIYDSMFSNDNNQKNRLYPSDWYRNIDYNQKIRILGEAIKEKIKIENTKEYNKCKKM